MKKQNLGNLIFIILLVLTVAVWFIFPPLNDGREDFVRTYAGEVMGSLVIVLMSFSLFLAARPKWAEPYFGGLDKMYQTHRRTSTSAFLLLLVKILVVPVTFTNLRLGNYLAYVSFFGIVAIVLPTLAPRIPFLNKLSGPNYESWKKLHRFIGIFFIVGYLHALTIDGLSAFVAINWVQVFFIIGTVSYLYTEFFGGIFKKHTHYTVDAVKHPNNLVTEVTLRPKGTPIQHRAGQFLFVRFTGDAELNEAHPFTISSAPQEDVLRLTIRASGDFTRRLFSTLKAGTDAIVEGAHGMFDYKTGGEKQIWVAGGIGVTPFLSFIRDLEGDALDHDVDFYYTVRHREEAVFVEELEEAANRHPRMKMRIRYSSADGSLTVEEIIQNAGGNIQGYHIYMCGPLGMVQAFAQKFGEAGVPAANIHFEEFNFR
jgi:predicted ferric reductase